MWYFVKPLAALSPTEPLVFYWKAPCRFQNAGNAFRSLKDEHIMVRQKFALFQLTEHNTVEQEEPLTS